ncbi:MAG: phage shock protein operon transcriptional activator, partial [Gammaproteobacteria bacterium]|nr:phage shock protein operon transcriptional activator [Gammaproteobacteria bacterium]
KDMLLPTNFKNRVRELEKELLQAALRKARFNQRMAADLLALSYDQLRGKIRKYGLDQH